MLRFSCFLEPAPNAIQRFYERVSRITVKVIPALGTRKRLPASGPSSDYCGSFQEPVSRSKPAVVSGGIVEM